MCIVYYSAFCFEEHKMYLKICLFILEGIPIFQWNLWFYTMHFHVFLQEINMKEYICSTFLKLSLFVK